MHALGYPVPRVDEWDGPRIVMERIDGPTLGDELLGGDCRRRRGRAASRPTSRSRLHALPWPGGRALLHLDFHPFNVLMGTDGPVVIDWTNAGRARPGSDVAMTALILAGVALTLEFPEAGDLLDGVRRGRARAVRRAPASEAAQIRSRQAADTTAEEQAVDGASGRQLDRDAHA